MGTDIQRLTATAQTLHLLNHARYDPADAAVVRLEPRVLVDEGQLGYDFGWEQSRRLPAELWEIKANPTLDEVREFVARLPRLVREGLDAKVRMVHGSPTAAARTLTRLFRHAGEATSPNHFAQIVEEAGTDSERELVELLGDEPLVALQAALPPLPFPEAVAESQIEGHCLSQAMPGRADDLRTEVEAEVAGATRTRGVVSLARLRDRLDAAGILRPAVLADMSDVDPTLVAALAVIEVCPVPVPLATLGHAVGAEPSAVADLLAELETVGRVTLLDGCAWMPRVGSAQVGGSGRPELYVEALRHLIDEAERSPATASAQTPNAEALARLAVDRDAYLVAGMFAAFDKPSKAYGDLGLVMSLARLSTQAGIRASELAKDRRDRIEELLSLRARNLICGDAWVLQRVDELEHAGDAIRYARNISKTLEGDLRNEAFGDKCEGRLLRMRAEEDLGSVDAPRLLEESKALLTDAVPKFTRLRESGQDVVQDIGECVCLLGRTLLVEGSLEEAAGACEAAHAHLDAFPASKAFGDLILLEAEIAASRIEAGAREVDPGILEEHLANVEQVRARFSNTRPVEDRAGGELVARSYMVEAHLRLLAGDVDRAASAYADAEDMNREMKYFTRAHQAAWAAAQLQPGAVPSPLAAALEEHKADAAVSYESLRLFRHRCEAQGLGLDEAVTVYREDTAWWHALVEEGERAVVAQRPRWTEGRAIA